MEHIKYRAKTVKKTFETFRDKDKTKGLRQVRAGGSF